MKHIINPADQPMQLNSLKAIRAKCLDCSGWNAAEVTRCEITGCPLWVYRFGRRPETSLPRANLSQFKAAHGIQP